MTTLPDRPNAALLVIDVQNGVMATATDREGVVSRINGLVEKARAAGTPVVWIQHNSDELPQGSPQWEYVPEVVQLSTEAVVHKRYGDSFEDTTLEAELARLGVGRVLVSGAETDACVRSTLHGAFTRGYDTVLVADAHTTNDYSDYGAPSADKVIAHTNLYWQFQTAPGRTAEVVRTTDVDFAATT